MKTTDTKAAASLKPSTLELGISMQSSPSGEFCVSPLLITADFGVQVKPDVKDKNIQASMPKLATLKLTTCAMTHPHVLSIPSTSIITSPSSTTPSSQTTSRSSVNGHESYQPPSSPSSSSLSELDEAQQLHFKLNRRKSTIALMEVNSRFYLGLPKTTYVLVKLLERWCHITHEHIFVTLSKVRLNDPYVRIADDFGMSVSNVSKIFLKCVPKIANVMQNFIFWPNTTQIKKNLPIPFRFRYSAVQSIIDCLEIEIEKPQNAFRQSVTWSEYKKCNTIKFLISCTPNGFINYISEAFAGRITDNNIVKESTYLDILPNNVSVMADRGFKQIDNILAEKQCKLIRPPSVSSTERPTKEQVRESKRISALRIHVERVIRRLREFEMTHMHTCVHSRLLPLMSQIAIISCGLINVQEPLIR